MQTWRGIAIACSIASLTACGGTRATAPASPQPKHHEAAIPAPTMMPRRAEPVPSSLTPDVVLATIKDRYLPGVERCYHRHLKAHSDASGRVTVSFTVDPRGQARDGAARGIAARVEDCIVAQMARWKFPVPRSSIGAPIEASFALGLQLEPR